MAKKSVDIIIDKKTGKISVHVDGYPQKECSALAKKLAGKNILIPVEGDISKPHQSVHSQEENIEEQKELNRNE